MRRLLFEGGEELDLHSLGRNGYMKQIGIDMLTIGNQIMIYPVTSKGRSGRAMLALPVSEVENLITILHEELELGNDKPPAWDKSGSDPEVVE